MPLKGYRQEGAEMFEGFFVYAGAVLLGVIATLLVLFCREMWLMYKRKLYIRRLMQLMEEEHAEARTRRMQR